MYVCMYVCMYWLQLYSHMPQKTGRITKPRKIFHCYDHTHNVRLNDEIYYVGIVMNHTQLIAIYGVM